VSQRHLAKIAYVLRLELSNLTEANFVVKTWSIANSLCASIEGGFYFQITIFFYLLVSQLWAFIGQNSLRNQFYF
jgi:hypothetical protein